MLDGQSLFWIANLVFQWGFMHQDTHMKYVRMKQTKHTLYKRFNLCIDVNKDYHTSQENDDLLELVLKYHILIQIETNTLLTYYLLLLYHQIYILLFWDMQVICLILIIVRITNNYIFTWGRTITHKNLWNKLPITISWNKMTRKVKHHVR